MSVRKLCKCGRPVVTKGYDNRKGRGGERRWRSICASCYNKRRKHGGNYITFEKKVCAFCGFVAAHPCQLDVDHKDGNSKNNAISNFQVLCANCHRLKTVLQEDWMPNQATPDDRTINLNGNLFEI